MPSKRMVPEQEVAELSDEIVRLHGEHKCDGGVPYVRLGKQCPKCGATADEGCRYTIPKLNAEIAALTEQRNRAMKVVEAARDVREWLKRNGMMYSAHGRYLSDTLAALDAEAAAETASSLPETPEAQEKAP